MTHRHDLRREGLLTGLIGAAVVALWFFVTDMAQGRPLSTPSILGQVFLYGVGVPEVSPAQTGPVVAYTALHIGAFLLFGVMLTKLIHLAMSSPLARFGLLVIAVCFELFFVFMTYAVFHATRYLFPWWSVLAANSLSLLAMGAFLVKRHPGLRRQFQREPLGGEPLGG